MKTNLQRIQRVISEHLGLKEEKVLPEKHITTDLGGDSLDRVEIVMALEDEFLIEILDEDAEGMHTVQDALNLVDKYLALART